MIEVITALVLALLLPACVAEPLAANEDRAAIVGGEVTSELGSVVAIAPRRVGCGDPAAVLCSGTLVTSHTIVSQVADTVLSAAHCFDSMRPGLAYEVFVGEAVDPDAVAISVVEVRIHPDFDAETRENDVAILWLERPANGVSPEVLPEAESALPELGDRVKLAGFGATSAGSTPDGLKRMGIGKVEEVGAGVVTVNPDPSVSCVGDSGGPLFTDTGALIGVASSGDPGCMEASVYALIAPTITGFVDPVLRAGPVERPPSVDSCGAGCTMDADCPPGFVCVPGQQSADFECVLPGQDAGRLTEACTDDGGCGGGFCAVASKDFDCQCYEPCDSAAPADSNNGCSVAHAARRAAPTWLLALLLWIGIRSRR
jgi:hypothetical protein